jgi:outer membrane biosynthesis protein TonB
VVILFRLDRQAQLVSSRILRTSGSATLDNAGLALVRQAQPFHRRPLSQTYSLMYRSAIGLIGRCFRAAHW